MRKKIRDGENQKRTDAGARKAWNVAKHGVFPMYCGSEGSKSRVAKAVCAETSGQMRDEELHAVVARSTIGIPKRQNTSFWDDCWMLRCGESARRCGAKHIWKSKVPKNRGF